MLYIIYKNNIKKGLTNNRDQFRLYINGIGGIDMKKILIIFSILMITFSVFALGSSNEGQGLESSQQVYMKDAAGNFVLFNADLCEGLDYDSIELYYGTQDGEGNMCYQVMNKKELEEFIKKNAAFIWRPRPW